MAPERRAVSQDFPGLTRLNPLSDAGGTGLRPRGARSLALPRQAESSCPAGRAWGSALSLLRVTFPGWESAEHRARETAAIGGELRGRHREHRWAAGPSGAAASARGSGPTRAAGRASSTGDPATRPPAWVPAQNTQGGCAPRAKAGTDEPAAGNSTTWRLCRPGPRVPGESRSGARRRAVPEICVPGALHPRRPPPGLHRPPRAAHPRPCRGGAASAPRAPHGARAAIATHRGRRGSGPPIRVAPPLPRVSCALRPREATGAAHRRAWGRLVLRLRRGRRRLPSSGLCCNVCEADFERLARRPPAAAALLPPPPTSRRPGPSPRCSTPFSSSAKFLNPFLPLPPIVTRAERAPGCSPEPGEPTGRLQASSLVLRVGVRG